jgi:hypothetical protein
MTHTLIFMAIHFAIAKCKSLVWSPPKSSLANSDGRSVCKLSSRDVSDLRYCDYDPRRLNEIRCSLNMRQDLRGRTQPRESATPRLFLNSFHRNKRSGQPPVRLVLIP